jgi:hypothetical protein
MGRHAGLRHPTESVEDASHLVTSWTTARLGLTARGSDLDAPAEFSAWMMSISSMSIDVFQLD